MARKPEDQPNDVHDDHATPPAGTGEQYEPDDKPKKDEKPKKDTKSAQAVRDAHFAENGVKADGTGGKMPGSE